jgi:hypothetical protein
MKFTPEFDYKSINELTAGHIAADPNSPGHLAIVASDRVTTLIALPLDGLLQCMIHENVVSVVQYRGETIVEVSLLGAFSITGEDLLRLETTFVMLEGQDRYLPFVGPQRKTRLLNLGTGQIKPANDPVRADVALPAFRLGVQESGKPVLWVYESQAFRELGKRHLWH